MNNFSYLIITNDFHENTFVSQGTFDYIVGSLMVLLALLSISFYQKAKRNLLVYKQEQLEVYNKNHKTNVKDYSSTTLFVPFWPRVKSAAPTMLFVLFLIMSIYFFAGTPIQTL